MLYINYFNHIYQRRGPDLLIYAISRLPGLSKNGTPSPR